MKLAIKTELSSFAIDFPLNQCMNLFYDMIHLIKNYDGKVVSPEKKEMPTQQAYVLEPEVPEVEEAAEKKKHGKFFMGGFVHIECEECGKAETFCAKERLYSYKCRNCGHDTEIKEFPKELEFACECGQVSRYSVYTTESAFDINCIKCGSPKAIEYNHHGKKYQKMEG